MRITRNYLVKWCNEQFEKLEIKEWVVTRVERTFHRPQDYENGAAHLLIFFERKALPKSPISHYFYCFYPIWYLQKAIDNGQEMYISFRTHSSQMMINGLEINLRKKTT